jgi:hypothetical protein
VESALPGKILIFETVTRAHIDELGKRFDRRFVLERNELLRSFPDLDVRRYWEGVADRSGRPRGVASLVAQRRADERQPCAWAQNADGAVAGCHYGA